MHPLQIATLVTWSCLFLAQLGLFWPAFDISPYWAVPLVAILLIPLKGLIGGRRYTYRWVGFLMLPYFCIGVSELASNPQLRIYGLVTTAASLLLFLASIYYARFLGLRRSD